MNMKRRRFHAMPGTWGSVRRCAPQFHQTLHSFVPPPSNLPRRPEHTVHGHPPQAVILKHSSHPVPAAPALYLADTKGVMRTMVARPEQFGFIQFRHGEKICATNRSE